jgi:hypothetical protein
MLDLEDLLRICRMFGLHYVAQPDLKEGPGPYLGIPGTFDFVVRKRRSHDATRALLIEGKPVVSGWFEDLGEISRSGCPRLVCEVLQAVDPELNDPDLRDLCARALILADRATDETAALLFEQPPAGRTLPDLTLGLYHHDQGRHAEALAHYRQVPEDHPDRTFLIGSCELQVRDWAAAAERFSAAVAGGSREVRDHVGLIAAHHHAGNRAAAAAAVRALAESRAGGEGDPRAAPAPMIGAQSQA